MFQYEQAREVQSLPAIPVETMRTLLVCRGPIAFETLAVYRRCHWLLPHVVVSAQEWLAEPQRAAPWLLDVPPDHVHYVQEYNQIEAVIALAREQGLDAIYPGYGFLAESVTFAERVRQAGLRFIGPTPETLRLLGEKDAAIAMAKRLGMLTIPGDDALIAFAHSHPQDATVAETVRRVLALAQQYPGSSIRLKHPAGGGGKGQRVLAAPLLHSSEAHQHILDALTRVWSEVGVTAAAANASKGVLLELNLSRPLHWEVQLFGDGNTVVHCAARDCSLQNHGSQKFIELALSPEIIAQTMRGLDPVRDRARLGHLRQRQNTLIRLCEEAVRLGTSVRLRGAATVEFLIDQQGTPYFLEVNPRIQVEHAVTESITRVHGCPISLVELQQRVAAGEELPFRQQDITFVGDAIEVRLNAWHEDLSPVLGGAIHALRCDVPAVLRPYVRIEAGGLLQRRDPWLIPSYDANFALLIVAGRERQETVARLCSILKGTVQLQGNAALHTNLWPLLGLLTLIQAMPPGTELRTDTAQLWMACAAMLMAQRSTVLALLPTTVPRQIGSHDPARFRRILRATLEIAFAHPSSLLTYYLQRLMEPTPRPLAALEILWQLAEALDVPLFPEEREQRDVLRAAVAALWTALAESPQQVIALLDAAYTQTLTRDALYLDLCAALEDADPALTPTEAADLIDDLLAWLTADIPAITALLHLIESTQLHLCLTVRDDLLLTRPICLDDDATVERWHRLLNASLRPTILQHGELLAPMEATIYHRSAPDAPLFVEPGAEVKIGQTLALLEAMKMFTELVSPVDGTLVAVLVEDGQGVKTGTPLFKFVTDDSTSTHADELVAPLQGIFSQRRPGLWSPPDVHSNTLILPGAADKVTL